MSSVRTVPNKGTFYTQQKPSLLILGSQISAAAVNGLAKHLESSTNHVHPLQVLVIRLLITGIGRFIYLLIIKPPGGLQGPKEQRVPLLIRAISGICGAVGFYFSIVHLTLVEATTLNFLAPLGSMLLAKRMFNKSLGWIDLGAALTSLASVACVLQPEAIFGTKVTMLSGGTRIEGAKKMLGLIYGLFGVLGGIISLTAIRYIGTTTHPMVGVNYFAWAVVVAGTFSLMAIPQIEWSLSMTKWLELCIVGLLGLAMEFLLAIGLSSDSSATATLMIYSQVLWAVLIDYFIYKDAGNVFTLIGSFGVIISLFVASLAQGSRQLKPSSDYYSEVPIDIPDSPGEIAMEEGNSTQTTAYTHRYDGDGNGYGNVDGYGDVTEESYCGKV